MAVLFSQKDKDEFYLQGIKAGFSSKQLDFMWQFCYALDRMLEDMSN